MKIIKYAAVLFLLICCYKVISNFIVLSKSIKNDNTRFPAITTEYLDLFSAKTAETLQPSYTFFNKYKKPIATFDLNKNAYKLMVYNIIYLRNPAPLPEYIHLKWGSDVDPTASLIYNASFSTKNMRFHDAEHNAPKSQNLYLDLDAKPVEQPITSDSLICYSINCTSLAAKCSIDGDVEYFLDKRTVFKDGRCSIAFKRFGTELFMFILTPNNLTKDFDTMLLYHLLAGNR
jgi:hypothetical protein